MKKVSTILWGTVLIAAGVILALKQAGILSEYFLFTWKGAVFDGIENSGDRVGGFTVQADDLETIVHKHNIAAQQLRVMDDQGQDMMRHDLLSDLTFAVSG